MIGDNDDAMSIRFSLQRTWWDFRTFLAIGAILDFKKISSKISQEALWLLGREGLKKYNNLNEKLPKQTSIPFYSNC